MSEPIKIKLEKLGRKGSWAEADFDTNTIILDPRVKGRKLMEMLIHEGTHLLQPYLAEEAVVDYGSHLTRILWEMGFRQIDTDVSAPLQDEIKPK